MKYPSHILLDLNKPTTDKLTKNWTLLYKSTFLNNTFNKSTKKLFNLGVINVNKSVNTLLIFNSKSKNKLSRNNSILWSLFDINFLKKEKLYTKLKYSRSPAYDIVSGGVAAIFAGFLGFLISEKFGMELVDSGDFYMFFMYCVFIAFSLRPLLKILSKENTLWHFFSYKYLISYVRVVLILFFRFLNRFFSILPHYNNLSSFFFRNEYISTIFKSIYNFIHFLKNYPKI